jgi:serine protease
MDRLDRGIPQPALAPATRSASTASLAASLAAALAAALLPGAAFAGSDWRDRYDAQHEQAASLTNRLIVKYREGSLGARASDELALAETHAAVRRHGLQARALRRNFAGAQVLRLDRRVTLREAGELAWQMKAGDPTIEYVEVDRLLQPLWVPNDSLYSSQWHYFEPTGGINLERAWNRATGAGINVAVVDTGVRPHADLAANLLPGYDFISMSTVSNDGDGRDADAADTGDGTQPGDCGGTASQRSSSWHGTHVAGTVAAVSNNGVGVAGVAFDAKIVPVRVLGKCGGYTSDIADGVIWAAGGSVAGVPDNAHPARVINMSLGGSGACGPTMQGAINAARSRGTVVVVAAGNSNAPTGQFQPASCAGVVNVAATTRAGAKAPYSNYGGLVDVAAPGGSLVYGPAYGVLSTLNDGTSSPGNDNYQAYQGTSMAAPHVAGIAALMLSANPALTPDQVEARLKSTTRPFPGPCGLCGSGIVNANAAVKSAFAMTLLADIESNDTRFIAQNAGTTATQVNGRMNSAADRDHFIVRLAAGRTLEAALAPNIRSNYDLNLMDLATGTVLLASSNRGNGQLDQIFYANTTGADLDIVVRVLFASGVWGSSGTYTLSLFP